MYTIYGKKDCPKCEKLKNHALNCGIVVRYIDLDSPTLDKEIAAEVMAVAITTSNGTLPIVADGKKYMNYMSALQAFLEDSVC